MEDSTSTTELSYDSDKNSDQSSSVLANHESRKRKFIDSWGKSFPWLEYNKESSTMFCKQCKKAKATTVWASTGCENLKKDIIIRHAIRLYINKLLAQHNCKRMLPVLSVGHMKKQTIL